MTGREIFVAYTSNKLHTWDAYLQAKEYYLTSASIEEKELFESYIKGVSAIISKSYAKSTAHFKVTIKKYGLTEEEALDLINKKNSTEAPSFLNRFSSLEQTNFLKNLYEQCEALRWHKQALEELANSYEISYELLINLISYYIKEFLKNSKTATTHILRRIEGSTYLDAFIKNKTIPNYSELVWYINTYGSDAEKEAYFAVLSEIISEFKNEKISLSKMAKLIARKYGINENEAKILVISYLNIEAKRNKEQAKREKYQEVYNMLLSDFTLLEVETYLSNYNLSIEEFTKVYLPEFLNSITEDEERAKKKKKIMNKINENLIKERNYRQSLRNKLSKIPASPEEILDAKRVITNLIHQDEDVKSLIALIGTEKFYRIITIVEAYDPELYALYYAKTNRGVYSINPETLANLAAWIINGIEDNGVIRPFNILDYFENIKVPLSSLPSILTNITESERNTIIDFVTRSKTELTSYQKRNNSEEERIIMKYLIENNIPLYNETFSLALMKYRQGTLQETGARI